MKSSIASLITALALVAALAAVGGSSASADGGGPTTILVGGKGVTSPDGEVRYVTLATGRRTIVSVVRVRGGQVVRWRLLRGYFGVPVIALDGDTEGVSRDGRTLVLAETPSDSSTGISTRFAVIDTRSLRLRRISLDGNYSYDALSPDASTLFLVEYLATGPDARYRVRSYDLVAGRLIPRAVVEKGAELVMQGQAVTRATSSDGRWAYTLYARRKREPFVHALDTVSRQSICIDLPLGLGPARQMQLRLKLGPDGTLAVRKDRRTVAVVDTRTFAVRRS